MKHIPDSIRETLAARFGLAVGGLAKIGGGEDWSDGTVWLDRQSGLALKVLDFARPAEEALQRAEDRVRLVGHLAEQGARVVRPLPQADGRLFAEAANGEKCYVAYCYRHARGRPARGDDPVVASGAFVRAVGAELARLHLAWERHPAAIRPDGGSEASGVLRGWREEMDFFRGWCREERVGRAWERLRQALESLSVERRGYGFIHNDAHIENIIIDPDSPEVRQGREPVLTFIDFDVSNFHWFMNDCASALYSFRIGALGGIEPAGRSLPPGFEERTGALFWEGYRRHRDPGDDWVGRLELFLHYRRCLLFMPFQEESAKHPAWRANWLAAIEEGDKRLFG